MKTIAFAALLLAGTALPAQAAPEKGKPEVTKLTQSSGGVLDPEQAKLQLDTVDLAIEVFPDREAIAGKASLTFITKGPVTKLLIDFDKNLPVTAVSIDGKPLRAGSWSNPGGRLSITLPARVAAGGRVT